MYTSHKYTHMIIQNHTNVYIYINMEGTHTHTYIHISKNACYTFFLQRSLETFSARPRSGAASVGVKKVNSLEELQATYEALDDISGWEKSSKSTLINHQLVTTRINWGPLKNWRVVAFIVLEVWCPRVRTPTFLGLFQVMKREKNPSLLGGFLVLSFGSVPFIFVLLGWWFFWFQDLLSFWVVVDLGRLEIRVKDLVMNIQVLTKSNIGTKNQSTDFLQKTYSGNSGSQADVFFFPPPTTRCLF